MPGNVTEQAAYAIVNTPPVLQKTVTDFNGRATTILFDRQDRMKTKSLPAITRMVSEVEVTDFPATTVTYDYDAVSGQRARVEQAGGVNRTVRYAHDDLGRLRVKEMPEGTLTYMYDDLGALTQITARSNYTGWAANPPYRFEDLSGSQASASSAEWNYDYDNLARLQKVNDDGSVADASYTYDAIGRLQTTGC